MPSHAHSRQNPLPLIGGIAVLAVLVAAAAIALSGLNGDAQSAAQPEVAAQSTPQTPSPSQACRDDVVGALTRYGLARQTGDGNQVLNDEQRSLSPAAWQAFSSVLNDYSAALADPSRKGEGLANTISALMPGVRQACSAADLSTAPVP